MQSEVAEHRRGDRFVFITPLNGTFTGTEITLSNVSLEGAQILHPQPLRLGTHGHLHFSYRETTVTVDARVIWSHLAQTEAGTAYRSGLELDAPDQQYATVLNALFRDGLVQRDLESLDKKRERMLEREERRKSQPYLTPVDPSPAGD